MKTNFSNLFGHLNDSAWHFIGASTRMTSSVVKTVLHRKYYALLVMALLLITVALSYGTSANKVTERKAPAVPNDLRFEETPKGLTVKWDPSSSADSYTLFWGTEKGEFRKLFETTEPAVLLLGLETGKMYNFAVTASNSSYESGFSPERLYVYDTDSTNSNYYLSTAKDLIDNNQIQEALAFLGAAIRLDPKNPESYRTRASLLEKIGKKNEARTDLQIAETLFNKKQMTSRN